MEELKEVELQGERHLVRLKLGRTLREKELYLLALPLPPTRCPSEYTLPPSAYPHRSLFRNATAFSPLKRRKIIDQKEKASELSQLCGLAINLDCCLEKPKNLPFLCFLLPIPPQQPLCSSILVKFSLYKTGTSAKHVDFPLPIH